MFDETPLPRPNLKGNLVAMGMEYPRNRPLWDDDSYRARTAVGAARPPPMMEGSLNLGTTLLIALGGALGTIARYLIALAALPISGSLPWGTILINIVGSFVIGFAGTLTLAHGRFPLPEPARLFLLVGFCGGFTTFSSFSLQTLDLLRLGAIDRAAINVIGSVVLCIAAVAAGHLLAAKLNGGAVAVVQTSIEEEA